MGFLLLLLIILGLVCILFSLYRYIQKDEYRFNKAVRRESMYLYENDGNVFITVRGMTFIGQCTIKPYESKYRVTEIFIYSKSPQPLLKNITKEDLYNIEEQLYTKYPVAELKWDRPFAELMESI
ncbi:hypothetical protein [Scopulibacillus cellulosilyticus]|uniref:Sigma-w pathway protein ysdB n=1 Tax=Scopulibacillus cellulosilyticus TaxID=2665665 RepID=A0ABW2PZG7_9BACL